MSRGVLVVDDDPFIRKLVATTLEDVSEFDLHEAADGVEALEVALREQPAIVFLDVDMPEMNGIEAAKIIRRYRPGTKIILVTGIDAVRDQAQTEGLRYLRKPVPMGVLAAYLEVTLGKN